MLVAWGIATLNKYPSVNITTIGKIMKVQFPNTVVDVESVVTDVREYKAEFDQLGLGNIDTTIELIVTIDGHETLQNESITAEEMVRMLTGTARLEIARNEAQDNGDCVAWIELATVRGSFEYAIQFLHQAESMGWMYVEEDGAIYYKYEE